MNTRDAMTPTQRSILAAFPVGTFLSTEQIQARTARLDGGKVNAALNRLHLQGWVQFFPPAQVGNTGLWSITGEGLRALRDG